uniref:Retrovirus-related Pol polyprotein from transposon TNT 1-94 n=1 Tax=Tanacetum cinerariifolium TaxID=118510 RepID=A0A699HT42_TANCI|nr:retrovirus-related Pol polyprotein from transposon TNT 1-94 [Tanacetum cinerariifolium]
MASASPICLMARASSTKSWLWHQRLSHLNFDTINDLARNDLMSSLPKFKYHKEHLCPFYEQGKRKRASHPPKPVPNSRQRLHLLHMDLCGPMRVASINGKRYVLVIVDDYSRYTWFKTRASNMTSGQINSGLDLTYAPSTITTQQPSEGELDLLFEAMYDDYIGGQLSATARTVPAVQEPQVRQTSTTSTSIADTAPTPTNSSSHATNIPITSQDVDELIPNAMVNVNEGETTFRVIRFSIYSDEWKSFQSQHQIALRIRRWSYNLIPAESRFKNPCSIIKDKYMMKAQVHVLKSSAISNVQALPQRKHNCQNHVSETFSTLGEGLLVFISFHLCVRAKSSRECQKPKRAKDAANHREKMLLCKQEEAGIQIRRWRYNLIPAESRFKNPCSIIKDKYMMKAQVHVSKSSAISDVQPLPRRKYFYYQVVKQVLRGRLLASFQDLEHEGGDTRSQGGMKFKDNDLKIKIQDHRRANNESKELPRTQGSKF